PLVTIITQPFNLLLLFFLVAFLNCIEMKTNEIDLLLQNDRATCDECCATGATCSTAYRGRADDAVCGTNSQCLKEAPEEELKLKEVEAVVSAKEPQQLHQRHATTKKKSSHKTLYIVLGVIGGLTLLCCLTCLIYCMSCAICCKKGAKVIEQLDEELKREEEKRKELEATNRLDVVLDKQIDEQIIANNRQDEIKVEMEKLMK
ncbi:unnamed protein product, partial [Didymodactylos carnosus]